jgi:polysaccharide export outer membrane protein
MPILGKVHVEGKTTNEIRDMLVKEISKDVKDPFVDVTIVGFKVNVLGEVKDPGTKIVTKERYSILDALADAKDLTEYGKRENVLLIREEGGTKKVVRLNLNDAKLLESSYFYLQQNDAIYVEANTIKQENSKYNQNNGFKLSVVSTIVSACSVIASLIIALVVK